MQFGSEQLSETIKYDLNGQKLKQLSKEAFIFNKYIAENSDLIIPVNYEYELAYSDLKNCVNFIPQPIDTRNITPLNTKKNSHKVKVFHGLNRYGMKGTRFIEKAFDKLKKNFSNRYEFIIKGRLSLENYLKEINQSSIIVDQCFSRSYGMNALYSMALQKVVLSGSEKIIHKKMGVKNIPVLNITPNEEMIYEVLSDLLDNPSKIENIAFKSREFVVKHHECSFIANKFLKQWIS